MTWDVPTEQDCPFCGQTMFKKSGRGRLTPFCINENCPNFLPEDKRGYKRRMPKATSDSVETAEALEDESKKSEKSEKPAKKTAAKKTTKSTKTTKTTKTAAKTKKESKK